MASRLLSLLLVGLLLSAGCLAGADPSGTTELETKEARADNGSQASRAASEPSEEPQIPTHPAFQGNRPANLTNLTVDDLFMLEMDTGPEAQITAFQWQVPPNGTFPVTWSFSDATTVPVEIAPIIPDGVELEAWSLMALAERDGEVDGLLGWHDVPMAWRATTVAITEEGEYTPDPEPVATYLGYRDLKPGDTVWFVLSVQTDQPATVGAAIRNIQEDPWNRSYDEPQELTDLTDDLDGRAPLSLPVTGEGQGYHVGLYADMTYLLGFQGQVWTSDVSIEEELPPEPATAASARQTTFSIEHEGEQGFTASYSSYLSEYAGHAWAIEATARDRSVQGHSISVDAPGLGASTYVLGSPGHYLAGHGAGSSSLTVELQGASLNEFEVLSLQQFTLGIDLEAATGLEVAEYELMYTGVGDALPPVHMSLQDGTFQSLSSAHGTQVVSLPPALLAPR